MPPVAARLPLHPDGFRPFVGGPAGDHRRWALFASHRGVPSVVAPGRPEHRPIHGSAGGTESWTQRTRGSRRESQGCDGWTWCAVRLGDGHGDGPTAFSGSTWDVDDVYGLIRAPVVATAFDWMCVSFTACTADGLCALIRGCHSVHQLRILVDCPVASSRLVADLTVADANERLNVKRSFGVRRSTHTPNRAVRWPPDNDRRVSRHPRRLRPHDHRGATVRSHTVDASDAMLARAPSMMRRRRR